MCHLPGHRICECCPQFVATPVQFEFSFRNEMPVHTIDITSYHNTTVGGETRLLQTRTKYVVGFDEIWPPAIFTGSFQYRSISIWLANDGHLSGSWTSCCSRCISLCLRCIQMLSSRSTKQRPMVSISTRRFQRRANIPATTSTCLGSTACILMGRRAPVRCRHWQFSCSPFYWRWRRPAFYNACW